MNIVCDTNILVSGILFGGHARDIIRMASRGNITNFISVHILRELEDVLARPKFGLSPDQVFSMVTLARDTFDFVDPDVSVKAVARDPDDDRVLEAALAADADFIVSGDKHLLELGNWKDIRITTASAFMQDIMGQQAGQEDSP